MLEPNQRVHLMEFAVSGGEMEFAVSGGEAVAENMQQEEVDLVRSVGVGRVSLAPPLQDPDSHRGPVPFHCVRVTFQIAPVAGGNSSGGLPRAAAAGLMRATP